MKNKYFKVLLFIVVWFVFLFVLKMQVYGASGEALVKNFSGTYNENATNIATSAIGPVLSVIRIVAIGMAVIMITYLGIKYVSSAPAEKASIKNQLIILTVGVVLIAIAPKVIDMIKAASKGIVTYT